MPALVQHTLARIEVQYVLERSLTQAETARMQEALHESLGYPFEIVFTRVSAISRSPGEKFEDFISLLN